MLYLPLILIVFAEVFRLIDSSKYRKVTRILQYSSLFAMIAIILLRFGIGSDYMSYKHIYESITKANISNAVHNYNNLEIGYIALNWISVSLGLSYYSFVTIINLITFALFVLWIYDNSQEENLNMTLSIFYSLFFIVWVLSTFRQSIVLAVIIYLFYSKKYKFKTVTKVIIVMLLSLLHRSALIILLYDFLSYFIKDRKSLLVFFIICFGFPLLPWKQLQPLIEILPFSKRILHYTNFDSLTLLKFSSLIRIGFAAIILLAYKDLAKDTFIKKLVHFYIIGTSLYLAFQFSELTSARLSIYSFFTLVILLPLATKSLLIKLMNLNLIKSFSNKLSSIVSVSLLTTLAIISFSSFSLYKELGTLNVQTNYAGNFRNPMDFPTIFNRKSANFRTKFGFIDHSKSLCFDSFSDLDEKAQNIDLETVDYVYQEGDYFTPVYSESLQGYIIINQFGEVVVGRSSHYVPNVYGVLYTYLNQTNTQQYYSYPSIDPNFDGMKSEYILNFLDTQRGIDSQIAYIKNVEQINDEEYSDTLEYLNSLGMDFKINSINYHSRPISYTWINVTIESNTYNLLLDGEDNLIGPILFTNRRNYDANGFMSLETSCGEVVINKDFDIVWFNRLATGGYND